MGYSEKITYVYMKRNYTTMTRLGTRMVWVHTHMPGNTWAFHLSMCCASPSEAATGA